MFKVIALLKRKPGMSVEDFQYYWRYKHGPLVAGRAEVRRHVQSHALLQGYQKGELLFDGISETWFDSAQVYEAYQHDPASSAILADQANFVDRSRTVLMPVDVHVIKFRDEIGDLLSQCVGLFGDPSPFLQMERVEPLQFVSEDGQRFILEFVAQGYEMRFQGVEHVRAHLLPFMPALEGFQESFPIYEYAGYRPQSHAGLSGEGDEVIAPVGGVKA